MIRIPESICVQTGEEERVQPIIDAFIGDVMRALVGDLFADPSTRLSVDSAELAHRGVITDDRVTYLRYRETVVAIVVQTRTALNHVRYDFFCNQAEICD